MNFFLRFLHQIKYALLLLYFPHDIIYEKFLEM